MKHASSKSNFYYAGSDEKCDILFKPVPKAGLNFHATIAIPKSISAAEISIIIPVKNNQAGINKLLESVVSEVSHQDYPKEIIIVDNNSSEPLQINKFYPFPVLIYKCSIPGPAAARNAGVAKAGGKWLLFTDSDCTFTPSMISGYLREDNECVAYAGRIEIFGDDFLNSYYRDQNALHPSFVVNKDTNEPEPWTLVTANCLILKSAFDAVAGFNEDFTIAGGEDTDLGFRMRHMGKVKFNPRSVSIHHFEDGLAGFLKRYVRYGKGNRQLADIYHGDFWPRHFTPNSYSLKNRILAWVAVSAMRYGYRLRSPSL